MLRPLTKNTELYRNTYIHTCFIDLWQPKAGLNKHTHIRVK